MTSSLTNRILVATGEVSLLVAALIVAPTWATAPASATVYSPGLVSETAPPAGILFDSPWIVDSQGTQWIYATTVDKMGTLVSRNPVTGVFTSTAVASGDEGSVAGIYSPQTNVAVFSVRRTGLQRMISFNLTTRARLSSRSLADGENNIRALAFNSSASTFIIGSKNDPPTVSKFDAASGFLDYSKSLSPSRGDVTAFIQNGTNLLAAIDSSPVALVPVSSATLTPSTPTLLPAEIPTILDPVVVGTTAFVGTAATPGRITAIDLATRSVIGSVSLNANESGARNLVVDSATGTLYATTETAAGTRLVSFTSAGLVRKGEVELGAGTSATDVLVHGQRLSVAFAGSRGFATLSTAPEPSAPSITTVVESDSALTVSWNAGASIEPILGFTATAFPEGDPTSQGASCTTTSTTCTVQGLRNGTPYTISVVARSVAGHSQPATTSATPRTIPEAPSIPIVTRGNAAISVTWTPRASGGSPITGFRATALPSGRKCESVTPSCTISGLVNGIAQRVSVVANNVVGDSAPSEPSRLVTPATTPQAPQITTAIRSSEGAHITWEPNTDDGGDAVSSYLVRVARGSAIVSESLTSDTSFTVSGLTNGVRYDLVVVATNAMGAGVPSPVAHVTPATAPTAPIGISVQRQAGGAEVMWNLPDSDGGDPITGYRVQVWSGSEQPRSFDAPSSPFAVIGLENGRSYFVTVRAINSVGAGSAPMATSVTPATVPEPPMWLSVSASVGGADVEWSPALDDGGDPIAKYRVTVWQEATITAEFETTSLRASLGGLIQGLSYRVSVASINTVGESAPAGPAPFSPLSPPVVDPPVVDPPVVDPPVVDPPVVDPPVVDPPVVDPPVVDPPVVDPPVVDPPVVDPDTPTPPTLTAAPGSPVDLSVLHQTRKHMTVGWMPSDAGTAPISDYLVQTSRFAARGYRTVDDGHAADPWVQLRKPRQGSLYVRVIAVNSVGESPPSAAKRVIRR